jgi:ent-kaurene oxidase
MVATAVTVVVGGAITAYLRRPKSFDLPMVGIDNSDLATLKGRYVQEADVLLREGYQKVSRVHPCL